MAHVILPGATPYEKDGTFTNDTGRVQRIREAIAPPGVAKPDWEIISFIGSLVNPEGFGYGHPSSVMEEISGAVPAYSRLNYENIGVLGGSTAS